MITKPSTAKYSLTIDSLTYQTINNLCPQRYNGDMPRNQYHQQSLLLFASSWYIVAIQR
jgi:hypothetical protein